MRNRIVLILASIVMMGVFLMGCDDRRGNTAPQSELDPSVAHQILTLNAPGSAWGIDLTCYYGETSVYVTVRHPHISDSPDVTCSYVMDEGGGSCRPDFANSACDCGWIPMSTRRFDIFISNTGDPGPLEYAFPFRNLLPATCEDDPAGWTMGHLCDPGGGLYIEFAYPNTLEATACDIVDESGTTYSCELRRNDAGTDTVCGCHGLPVLGQQLIREIVLRDGTTLQAYQRFTGIDEHYCDAIGPTQGVTPEVQQPQPPVQTCADQQTYDSCKMFGGCYWWSSGGCYSNPEAQQPPPPPPACDTYGDEKACTTNNCKWDPYAKPPCY